MMVTDFRCWWQNHYVGDFFRYVGDFLNVFNRSPTSQTCHQHIWSPTSVTYIDVTVITCENFLSDKVPLMKWCCCQLWLLLILCWRKWQDSSTKLLWPATIITTASGGPRGYSWHRKRFSVMTCSNSTFFDWISNFSVMWYPKLL